MSVKVYGIKKLAIRMKKAFELSSGKGVCFEFLISKKQKPTASFIAKGF